MFYAKLPHLIVKLVCWNLFLTWLLLMLTPVFKHKCVPAERSPLRRDEKANGRKLGHNVA